MYKNMGIKGLDYKEITSLPKSKNVMNNLWRVITCNSIIARKKTNTCLSQDSFAYNESLQHPTS